MAAAAVRSADVLATFQSDLARQRRTVEDWRREHDDEALTRRPSPRRWSAIDCLEHVRRANGLYLKAMDRALTGAERRGKRPVEEFRPGAVGTFMRNTLRPRTEEPTQDGRPKIARRMPTAGNFDPTKDAIPPDPGRTIDAFLGQLDRMTELAQRLEGVDLHVRTNTLLGPFLRLRMGDVARYLMAHTDRHLVQAERAIASTQKADDGSE